MKTKTKEQIKKIMKERGLYKYYAPLRKALSNIEARKIAFEEYGLKFVRNADISEIFKYGAYTGFEDFIPTEKDTVLDVGAQYGDYALLCASLGATVHAVEPLPKNFDILMKNLGKNPLTKGKVFANRKAVGSYNKTIKMAWDERTDPIETPGQAREERLHNEETGEIDGAVHVHGEGRGSVIQQRSPYENVN